MQSYNISKELQRSRWNFNELHWLGVKTFCINFFILSLTLSSENGLLFYVNVMHKQSRINMNIYDFIEWKASTNQKLYSAWDFFFNLQEKLRTANEITWIKFNLVDYCMKKSAKKSTNKVKLNAFEFFVWRKQKFLSMFSTEQGI